MLLSFQIFFLSSVEHKMKYFAGVHTAFSIQWKYIVITVCQGLFFQNIFFILVYKTEYEFLSVLPL